MPAELDIYGAYLPTLSILMLVSYGIFVGIRAILTRVGLYRFIWHSALFNVALYVLVLATLAATARMLFG